MKKTTKKILNSKRLKLFNLSKNLIEENGWNEELFDKISKNKKSKLNQLNLLFPEGYKEMLKYYMMQLNKELELECVKNKLDELPLHKRIKKIILTKIKIINKNNNLYKKTISYMLLPFNHKLLLSELYKSVDLMWYIANDKSTDFNFYTKRIILSGLYLSVVKEFINNNITSAEKKLDNNLVKVLKITSIKQKLNSLKKNLSF